MKTWAAACIVVCMTVAGCSGRATLPWGEYEKRVQGFEKESVRLETEKDPVGRTKRQIRISEFLLTFVADAVQNGQFDTMERHLQAYLAAITDAHRTMMETGRNARSKPAGFRDLELAIRRHLRYLEDFGGMVSLDQRTPLNRTIEEISGIRDWLIRAIFLQEMHAATDST